MMHFNWSKYKLCNNISVYLGEGEHILDDNHISWMPRKAFGTTPSKIVDLSVSEVV